MKGTRIYMRKEEKNFAPSTIMEGMTSIRAVISVLENAPERARKIKEILYDKEREVKLHKEINWLKRISEIHGFSVNETDTQTLASLCLGNTHGGIIALTEDKTIPPLSDCADFIKKDGFYVMIEGIEDPYNFGYALRSLYAFGADGVVLPERNWMTAAGVVARASAGASELLPMATANAEDAIDLFHQNGYFVVCGEEKTDLLLEDTDIKFPVFLIVGGEKRGISSAVLKKADQKIKIDYGRHFAASLSAASAAAVFAYEIAKQRNAK